MNKTKGGDGDFEKKGKGLFWKTTQDQTQPPHQKNPQNKPKTKNTKKETHTTPPEPGLWKVSKLSQRGKRFDPKEEET